MRNSIFEIRYLTYLIIQDRGTDPTDLYGYDDYYAYNSQEYQELEQVFKKTMSILL